MPVVSHPHLSHVLALLVGGVVEVLPVGWAIVFEQSGAQCGDSETADEDDHDDRGGGDGHGRAEGRSPERVYSIERLYWWSCRYSSESGRGRGCGRGSVHNG